jgi:hypothetical protein
MSDRREPTAEDLAEMRDQALGNVDFEPTGDQLREVCRRDPQLLALAMVWSLARHGGPRQAVRRANGPGR